MQNVYRTLSAVAGKKGSFAQQRGGTLEPIAGNSLDLPFIPGCHCTPLPPSASLNLSEDLFARWSVWMDEALVPVYLGCNRITHTAQVTRLKKLLFFWCVIPKTGASSIQLPEHGTRVRYSDESIKTGKIDTLVMQGKWAGSIINLKTPMETVQTEVLMLRRKENV